MAIGIGSSKQAAKSKALAGLRRMLPDSAPSLMQLSHFWPHAFNDHTYARPLEGAAPSMHDGGLPMPPRELWAYYCTTPESFLESGRADIATMRSLLEQSGAPIEQASRVLDLGCAGGRMTRHLADLAEGGTQVWGTDIWSTAILWCQDHLSPPLNFAVTTMMPHLPFEDRSFDLVYCGSLFTHIDDLAETWFLELHRVIKPGGRLYFSINDQHAARLFEGDGDPDDYPGFYERTGGKETWDTFVADFTVLPGYKRFRRGDAYMVTLGRSMNAHVMWDTDVLTERLSYGWDCRAITPQSYGHQTTVLLERK